MDLDRNIHLEPFIRIPNQYLTKKKTVKACEIHGQNYSGDKFCRECGDPIISKEVDKQYRIWYCDITENENLWEHTEGEFTYLLSNIPNICSKYSMPNENGIQVLTGKDIEQQKEEFETYHSKDIELLKSKLNIDINVEFGLLYHVW